MKKKLALIATLALSVVMLAGCQSDTQADNTPATATEAPTEAPEATEAPAQEDAEPTAAPTVEPTATPEPTATSTPTPEPTPTEVPHEHEWITILLDATCTEDGKSWNECCNCGERKDEAVIPALGHGTLKYAVISEPTVEKEGSFEETCEVCGAVVLSGSIAKLEPTPTPTPKPTATPTPKPTATPTPIPASTETSSNYFKWNEKDDGTIEITGVNDDLPNEVVIPEKINGKKVTSIGALAFYNCYNLTTVSVPEGVTIKSAAFYYCTSLTNIELASGITIGDSVFKNCSSLLSVELPEGITIIEMETFSGCSSLESVTIPDSIKVIDRCAFDYCRKLKSITIPNKDVSIERAAFRGCKSLTLTLPEGMEESEWWYYY